MGMGGSSSGSGAATSVTSRRKSEERVGGNTKKSKQEASHKASPPRVRNDEKIRAKVLSPELLSKHSHDFVSNLLSLKRPK
jgi:hypothetical protein